MDPWHIALLALHPMFRPGGGHAGH